MRPEPTAAWEAQHHAAPGSCGGSGLGVAIGVAAVWGCIRCSGRAPTALGGIRAASCGCGAAVLGPHPESRRTGGMYQVLRSRSCGFGYPRRARWVAEAAALGSRSESRRLGDVSSAGAYGTRASTGMRQPPWGHAPTVPGSLRTAQPAQAGFARQRPCPESLRGDARRVRRDTRQLYYLKNSPARYALRELFWCSAAIIARIVSAHSVAAPSSLTTT